MSLQSRACSASSRVYRSLLFVRLVRPSYPPTDNPVKNQDTAARPTMLYEHTACYSLLYDIPVPYSKTSEKASSCTLLPAYQPTKFIFFFSPHRKPKPTPLVPTTHTRTCDVNSCRTLLAVRYTLPPSPLRSTEYKFAAARGQESSLNSSTWL
jgi:hypothetical protein